MTVNPYQPPAVDVSDAPLAVFPSRYAPRDAVDILVGLGFGIPIAFVLVGGGAAAFYFLGWDPVLGCLLALFPAVALGLSGLESVIVRPSGLQLRRFTRQTITIPWEIVTAVRPVTRWEVLTNSLLRPHWSASMSATSRDQIRIEWQGGSAIFAPREPAVFLETLQLQIGRATRSEA